jgi:hypothetical protein
MVQEVNLKANKLRREKREGKILSAFKSIFSHRTSLV